jgi:hypothetical protein
MYISGQKTVGQCTYNIDSRYPTKVPPALSPKGRIFMKVCDIPAFIRLPLLFKPDVVVHNSDESFTEQLYNSIKHKAGNVYAVNCVTDNAIPIPLGFRDHQYTSHHIIKSVLAEPQPSRDIKCLVNFLIATNSPVRQAAFDFFKDNPACLVQDYVTYNTGKSFAFTDPETQSKRVEFYRSLRKCEFAICPAGTGIDTHRVYECILFGVIPIVLTSPLDRLYKQFPVWIVKDWSDVKDFAGCPVTPNPDAVINFKMPWE